MTRRLYVHPTWLDAMFWEDIAAQVTRLNAMALRAKEKKGKPIETD